MQDLPKQMRLVVDVSGSMYRFNGLDGRLERMMEAACLVMESFDQYQQRFKVNCVNKFNKNTLLIAFPNIVEFLCYVKSI